MKQPITKLAASPQQQGPLVPDAPFDLDVKLCTATYTISSSAVDNDGDILVPAGSLPHLARFTANPAVLWNHNRDCAPIAQSINPATKQLSWVADGDRVKATAHFHLLTQESAQCWALVENGVLRGASVGFDAVQGKTERLQGGGIKFLEWVPIEWSVCPIPNNPETLLEAVNRQWDGKSLSPTIVKSLMAYVPKSNKTIVSMAIQPKKYINISLPWLLNSPFSSDEVRAMVQSNQKAINAYGYCPTCNSPVVSRTRGGPNSKDTCSQGHTYPAKESKAMADDTTKPAEEVKDDSPANPPGAQAIMGFTADIESALENLNTAISSIENPDVLQLFEGVGTAIQEQVTALKDGLSSIYPDLNLEPDDGEDPEPKSEDDKEDKPEVKGKSLTKSDDEPKGDHLPHIQAIQDAGEVVKEMSESPNVPKSYRMACKGIHGGLMACGDYMQKCFAKSDADKPEMPEDQSKDEPPPSKEEVRTDGESVMDKDDDEMDEESMKALKSLSEELAGIRKEIKRTTGKVQ